MSIPRLDFNEWLRTESRAKFSHEFRDSLAEYGFARLINSPLARTTIDDVFELSRHFFALPSDIKAKAAHPKAPFPHRGWSAVGEETFYNVFDPTRAQDLKYEEFRESFDQGPMNDTLCPNRWVDEKDLPGFRQVMEDYYEQCDAFHTQLIKVLASAFNVPADGLIAKHYPNSSELRLNHYPPIPCKYLGHGMRIGAHSDFGTLTILVQDAAGGLQVEDQDRRGQFIPVDACDRYEVIINVGDCLQRWTNDQLRSAVHRVTLPQGKATFSDEFLGDRYSIAYFGKPARNTLMDTLPEFSSGNGKCYSDHLTMLQYNKMKLHRTYQTA